MRRLLVGCLLLCALAGCALLDGTAAPTPAAPTPAFAVTIAAPRPGLDPLRDGEAARVVEVIDGDTIDVSLNGRRQRVRYVGVDTPEREQPFYAEATAANRRLVEGQTVYLLRDVSETDQFGRLLRFVYLADGRFVNAELIGGGYARLITIPPDVAMQAVFQELERQARAERRGLWGASELLGAPPGCDVCNRNAYNCSDFTTQAAAQACYDYCFALSGADVHRLDGRGDGRACRSLP